MTCPTCEDKLWITGVPYSTDPDKDAEDLRDWIVPCPDCSSNLTPSQVAKIAARDVEVGWTLLFYVNELSQGERNATIHLQAWPFALQGDSLDNISSWMDHEPDLSEMVRMNAFDQADKDSDPDTDRKLT